MTPCGIALRPCMTQRRASQRELQRGPAGGRLLPGQVHIRTAVWLQVRAVEEVQPGLMQQAQRFFLLTQIDNLWKEHLQAMNFLRQAVGLRGCEPASKHTPVPAQLVLLLWQCPLCVCRSCPCLSSPCVTCLPLTGTASSASSARLCFPSSRATSGHKHSDCMQGWPTSMLYVRSCA
jgi:hypothetical protein